jgi:hypothetical protein
MTSILIYAFTTGNFFKDGNLLLDLPWGIVSLVDLYVGFILFSLWIIYREDIWWHAAIWVILMLVLGFFTGSLYVFLTLVRSDEDWTKFWMGKHAD